jgi:hypothetical protein
MGGQTVIPKTLPLGRGQEDKVLARFEADRDEACREFLDTCDDVDREVAKEEAAGHDTSAELEEDDVDLKTLWRWLTTIRTLEVYGAPLRAEADQRRKACEAILDAHAQRVCDAQAENR